MAGLGVAGIQVELVKIHAIFDGNLLQAEEVAVNPTPIASLTDHHKHIDQDSQIVSRFHPTTEESFLLEKGGGKKPTSTT